MACKNHGFFVLELTCNLFHLILFCRCLWKPRENTRTSTSLPDARGGPCWQERADGGAPCTLQQPPPDACLSRGEDAAGRRSQPRFVDKVRT